MWEIGIKRCQWNFCLGEIRKQFKVVGYVDHNRKPTRYSQEYEIVGLDNADDTTVL